jgi:hypothetical protein
MTGAFSLDHLQPSGQLLFPNLLSLSLERFDADGISVFASHVVSVLEHHAPLLELLELGTVTYGWVRRDGPGSE